MGNSLCLLQIKGSSTGPVTVVIPPSITKWGKPLLTALATAVNAPDVVEVWIHYGDDGEEEQLKPGRVSWRTLKGMDLNDVVLVVSSVFKQTRLLFDSSTVSGRQLPEGKQRYKRLTHLLMIEPIPKLVQKVNV